jgi:hypothetical protein
MTGIEVMEYDLRIEQEENVCIESTCQYEKEDVEVERVSEVSDYFERRDIEYESAEVAAECEVTSEQESAISFSDEATGTDQAGRRSEKANDEAVVENLDEVTQTGDGTSRPYWMLA